MMNVFEKINEYLKSISILDDDIYNYLLDNYGYKVVEAYVCEMIKNKNTFKEIYKKISLDSKKNDMVIEKILLVRINKIKREIEKLIHGSGLNPDKGNLLYDKMIYIDGKIKDKNIMWKIRLLYQEFTIIRNRIWNYYLDMLDQILSKYIDDVKYADIYQEAGIALMTAIEKFGPDNYYFKGFAASYIRYSINYHYHDLDLCLKLPMNMHHKYYKMLKTIQNYVDTYHKMPTKDELCELLNVTDTIMTILLSHVMDDVSYLSDNVLVDCEYMKKEEVISDNQEIRLLENETIGDNLHNALVLLLDKLSDKERMVIDNYFLKDNTLTLGQIAEKLGVSYGTGMNIKRRALTKLRIHGNELIKYLR